MKRTIFAAVAALTLISAGSAGSTPLAVAPLGVPVGTQLDDPLDSCQLAYYSRCMAVSGGDHGYCYDTAASYACP